MPMQNPPHPGEVVKIGCVEPLGLTVKQTVLGLGARWTAALAVLVAGCSASFSAEECEARMSAVGRASGLGLHGEELAEFNQWRAGRYRDIADGCTDYLEPSLIELYEDLAERLGR